MKTTMNVLAAALLAIGSSAAMAEGGKFYVAGDVGQASYSSNVTSSYSNTAFPKPGLARIGGGFHFSQYAGVEAGYAVIGDSTIISSGAISAVETLKSKSLQVAAVVTYPVNDRFDLFGKVGMANNKVDYTYASGGGTITSGSTSASKTDLLLGLGGQFNINKHFGIRAQYEDFGKVTFAGATSSVGIKAFSVGGVYNF